jgi:hypothetical protein
MIYKSLRFFGTFDALPAERQAHCVVGRLRPPDTLAEPRGVLCKKVRVNIVNVVADLHDLGVNVALSWKLDGTHKELDHPIFVVEPAMSLEPTFILLASRHNSCNGIPLVVNHAVSNRQVTLGVRSVVVQNGGKKGGDHGFMHAYLVRRKGWGAYTMCTACWERFISCSGAKEGSPKPRG